MTERVFIIAEAGVNHCGDIEKALKMVQVAAKAGADAIKFQTFKADSLTTANAPKAHYQEKYTGNQDSQRAMLARLELSEGSHELLVQSCQDHGIEFMSTGFDTSSVDMLVALGIKRVKIPSGEITNLPLLRHIATLNLPVILSTGMANLQEVAEANTCLMKAGLDESLLSVLHCTTAYPTPFSEANLRCIQTLKSELGLPIGYSDHTLGNEAAVAAVALGACIVEKHFTLDRNLPGPDQFASLEPAELNEFIEKIRHVEVAMGDGIKQPTKSEIDNIAIARQSLVASARIARGERFTPDNLTTKRPGTGLSPMLWDRIIGRIAKRDYDVDDLLDHVEQEAVQ